MTELDMFYVGVKALIKDDRGDVLLLQVNLSELPGYEGEAYWDIPGGRIHRGESTDHTLAREVYEETGLQLDGTSRMVGASLSTLRIPHDESDVGLVLFVYECKLPRDNLIVLSPEHVAFRWFTSSEAADALKVKYPPEFAELLMR